MPTLKKITLNRDKIKPSNRWKDKGSNNEYNTSAWQQASKGFRLENPLCINYDVCRNKAQVVDHKHPVRQGGEFWDRNNWQQMCKSCHNRKSALEKQKYNYN